MRGGRRDFTRRPVTQRGGGLTHVPGIAVLRATNIAADQRRDPQPRNSARAGTWQLGLEPTWHRTPRWDFGGI